MKASELLGTKGKLSKQVNHILSRSFQNNLNRNAIFWIAWLDQYFLEEKEAHDKIEVTK